MNRYYGWYIFGGNLDDWRPIILKTVGWGFRILGIKGSEICILTHIDNKGKKELY